MSYLQNKPQNIPINVGLRKYKNTQIQGVTGESRSGR